MSNEKVSLKISLSPRDYRFVKYLLPHQLKMWYDQVDEVLLVYDSHGYDDEVHRRETEKINLFINNIIDTHSKVRVINVDYSPAVKKAISTGYFNGKHIPNKTHRYGPYYSYFYGLHYTRFNYVFHIDADMFFGGDNANWITEAIGILHNEPDVITCSPFPGPPTANGRLLDQPGEVDGSHLKKIYFNSFSTRLFFINKQTFIARLCPIPVKIAAWPLLYRALLRLRPVYALPEDILTAIMRKKKLKRVDFLGSGQGVWSLHPPFRNEAFFKNLPLLIDQIENGNIPEKQRGYYDMNGSMIDWTDAIEQIKQASIKRRILNKLRIRNL